MRRPSAVTSTALTLMLASPAALNTTLKSFSPSPVSLVTFTIAVWPATMAESSALKLNVLPKAEFAMLTVVDELVSTFVVTV